MIWTQVDSREEALAKIFESVRGGLVGRDSSAMKHPIIGPWKEIMAKEKEKEMTTRTQHEHNNTLLCGLLFSGG